MGTAWGMGPTWSWPGSNLIKSGVFDGWQVGHPDFSFIACWWWPLTHGYTEYRSPLGVSIGRILLVGVQAGLDVGGTTVVLGLGRFLDSSSGLNRVARLSAGWGLKAPIPVWTRTKSTLRLSPGDWSPGRLHVGLLTSRVDVWIWGVARV
jgi:hypothetical protein